MSLLKIESVNSKYLYFAVEGSKTSNQARWLIKCQSGLEITIPLPWRIISAADWFYSISRVLKLASRANKNIYYHPKDLETAFYKNDHSTQLPMVYCHGMLNCNHWFEELPFVERDFKNCDFWYGFGTNTRDIFILNKNDLKIISGSTLSGELGYNIVLTNPDKVYCWKR